ncbi:Peptidase C1 and/or Propeptide C1 domain containing protein [Asbolus verrucosus]|uniref:Peptidase C1 and/or Propeptide C1 domain containing protein n=1 Tax=Asbolus verrucosus TaxID=1661398 RepID=A0A482W0N1_ASBVE|nr:Peptidase C1 and/or Propeptide C1 domain containing protein [Asbolus verrucosus]
MNSFGIISIILLLPLQCWTKSSFLSKNFIDSINRKQSTWIAGRNFPEDTPIESLKYLAGTLGFHPDPNFEPPTKVRKLENVAIPDTFDARTEWPECKDIIGKIRNQGNCGSCWAFASAEIMTDSLCIKSNGTVKFEFSPEDLISCCAECGNCKGGYTGKALNYWVKTGVVSGGDYNSGEGCRPYSESTFLDNITPSCKQQCENSNYTIPYSDDKAFGTNYYHVKRNQKDIQAEIMLNGPVLAGYVVYTDFLNYKTGVYQHVSGVKNQNSSDMTFSLLVIGILCAWSSCKADDNTTFLPEPTTTDSQNPYGEEISPYNLTKEQLRRMCGSYHIFGEDSYTRNVDYVHHKVDKIPPTFDAREKWPYCESIGTIRNQGFCGSCWAVASAAVISDRMCIENKGKIAPHISSEDILRCCRGCCRSPNPCAGGDMRKAMVYWVQYGVVSGGEFRSHEGCKPYSKESYYDRPTSVHCLRNCTNKDYNVSYEKDQQHGRKAYTISKEVEQIQTEIVLNGPVIASLRIYEDFFTYVTGIVFTDLL